MVDTGGREAFIPASWAYHPCLSDAVYVLIANAPILRLSMVVRQPLRPPPHPRRRANWNMQVLSSSLQYRDIDTG